MSVSILLMLLSCLNEKMYLTDIKCKIVSLAMITICQALIHTHNKCNVRKIR